MSHWKTRLVSNFELLNSFCEVCKAIFRFSEMVFLSIAFYDAKIASQSWRNEFWSSNFDRSRGLWYCIECIQKKTQYERAEESWYGNRYFMHPLFWGGSKYWFFASKSWKNRKNIFFQFDYVQVGEAHLPDQNHVLNSFCAVSYVIFGFSEDARNTSFQKRPCI